MEQRYDIAEMLAEGRVYTDIKERTTASSAIISRVNRVLSADGSVLLRLIEEEQAEQAAPTNQPT